MYSLPPFFLTFVRVITAIGIMIAQVFAEQVDPRVSPGSNMTLTKSGGNNLAS